MASLMELASLTPGNDKMIASGLLVTRIVNPKARRGDKATKAKR
jgi:hypothetical protein